MFSKQIKIGGKMISNDSPAFIIAEAGVNHNVINAGAGELVFIEVEMKAHPIADKM